MEILVDSNVILDVLTEDPQWFSWSSETLSYYADNHILVINPIIYAEVSIGFELVEEVEKALPPTYFRRDQRYLGTLLTKLNYKLEAAPTAFLQFKKKPHSRIYRQ